MKAGNLDVLITIERNGGTVESGFGEPTETWATYTIAWANVQYGSASESRETATEASEQVATFHIRADPETLAITTQDRISFGGVWDIEKAVPYERDEVRLTAVKRG